MKMRINKQSIKKIGKKSAYYWSGLLLIPYLIYNGVGPVNGAAYYSVKKGFEATERKHGIEVALEAAIRTSDRLQGNKLFRVLVPSAYKGLENYIKDAENRLNMENN